MAYAEFYNLNAYRAYPFIPTATDTFKFIAGGDMPNGLVLDCGFTIGGRLQYTPEVGAVYLDKIKRSGDNLEFTFRVLPDDGTDREFVFVRDKNTEFGTTDYVEATGGAVYGIGFLATGNLLAFHTSLADGEEKVLFAYSHVGGLDTYEATVEPALVVSLKDHAVITVSVGNVLRLEDQPCDGCGSPTPIDNTTVKLQAGALEMVGAIRLKGGYNVAVTANTSDNSLSLVGAVGEGLGEVCDNDLVRYDGDVPDQGDRCYGFIYTINGVTPNENGAFRLEGAGNFFVRPESIGLVVVNSRIGQTTVCPDE